MPGAVPQHNSFGFSDVRVINASGMNNAQEDGTIGSVDITAELTEEIVEKYLDIADDGPGIPEDKKAILLERGKRLDTYTEGHGIGMALVADLVSIYEGRMKIEDSVLGGASVTVSFPQVSETR
jgi:signal transduction histidine kinase